MLSNTPPSETANFASELSCSLQVLPDE